ncbi:MAG TPA: DMT family transporter [Longimicrobiales bacterium]|nr:DMT family transporter [Longimicrobiales bacterium]
MAERDPGSEPRGAAAIPIGLRYMAASAFFFSVMSLLVKAAGQRLPTQEIVLARSSVGALLSWMVLRSRGVSVLGNRKGLLVVRALLGYGALSCFFYALVHLPLADATVIQYTNPVFTALLAAALLSEKLRAREIVLVLVSLAGVVLMARPGFLFGGLEERLALGAAAIALLGALLSAGAYVTVRKLGATEDPLVIIFYFAAVSSLGAIPLTAADAVLPTAAEWAALAGIGVITQLGQVCLTKGLRLEPAGRAMAVGYMQIVFAALWGLLFFAELPDAWGAAGALLIIAGTFGIARR